MEIFALIFALYGANHEASRYRDSTAAFIFTAIVWVPLYGIAAAIIGFVISILIAPVIGIRNIVLGSKIESGEKTIYDLNSLRGRLVDFK